MASESVEGAEYHRNGHSGEWWVVGVSQVRHDESRNNVEKVEADAP